MRCLKLFNGEIMYRINYNLQNLSLKETYHNWQELDALNMPTDDLSIEDVDLFFDKVPKKIRYQFEVSFLDKQKEISGVWNLKDWT